MYSWEIAIVQVIVRNVPFQFVIPSFSFIGFPFILIFMNYYLTLSGRNYWTRLVPETLKISLTLMGLFCLFRPTTINKKGNFKQKLGCTQAVTFIERLLAADSGRLTVLGPNYRPLRVDYITYYELLFTISIVGRISSFDLL